MASITSSQMIRYGRAAGCPAVRIKHPIAPAAAPADELTAEAGLTAKDCTLSVPPLSTAVTA
jgi:hypothetical protein